MVKFSTGDGSSDNPYEIENIEQLQAIKEERDAHYIIVNDIDAGETDKWNNGNGFEPIGDFDKPFIGSLDGQGHRIYDLYINRPFESEVGLFGYISSGAHLSGVKLDDVVVIGNDSVGSICGTVCGPTMLGGDPVYIDGVSASGYISGNDFVGGLFGQILGNLFVTNSYSTVNVYGYDYVGGLVGISIFGGPLTATVENTYSTGVVMGNDFVGGLMSINDGSVINSYWNVDTSEQEESDGGEPRTTEEMVWKYDDNTYEDWNFDDIWQENIWNDDNHGNSGYPALSWEEAPDPIPISNVTHLQGIEIDLWADYELLNDIDATDTENWNDGKGFKPIGDEDTFRGVLHGNGYIIKGLYIDRPKEDFVGLFRGIYAGLIMEIGFEDSYVNGNDYVGIISGWTDAQMIVTCDIYDVFVDGIVEGNSIVGGMVGYLQATTGLQFAIRSNIINSYSFADVRCRGDGVGGIMGVGGVEGGMFVHDGIAHIYKSFSTGYVDHDEESEYHGGISGAHLVGDVIDSYWNIETSGQDTDSNPNSNPRTTEQMTFSYPETVYDETYEDWDFDVYWKHSIWNTDRQGNRRYPALQWQQIPDPIEISDIKELQMLWFEMDANYKQVNDIDASETEDWWGGEGFYPIGDEYEKFEGVYDGNDYEITNIHINYPEMQYVGLFGRCGDVLLENIKLRDCFVVGDSRIGSICGDVSDDTKIVNCHSDGYVEGSYIHSGGISGICRGLLDKCSFTGEVNGSDWYAGGLAGTSTVNSHVSRCFTFGYVYGNNGVGGLVASLLHGSELRNSFSCSEIHTDGIYVGGLIGTVVNSTVFNSFSTGSVPENGGGLIGSSSGLHIYNSYWNEETSGRDSSDGGEPRTTQQMTWEYDDTYDNWDFDDVWVDGDHYTIKDHQGNRGYPALHYQDIINYEITNWEDLHNITNYLEGDYILSNDLDKDTYGYEEFASEDANDGYGWKPIGDRHNHYLGVFDGQGNIVKDFHIDDHGERDTIGLFATIEGEVKNLGIQNANIKKDISSGWHLVGGLTGQMFECEVDSCFVRDSYVYSNAKDDAIVDVGAMLGHMTRSKASNCYTTGEVEGEGNSQVGGFCGVLSDTGEFEDIYASARVTGGYHSGGFSAREHYTKNTTFKNTYWNSEVSGQDYGVQYLYKWPEGEFVYVQYDGLYERDTGQMTWEYSWSNSTFAETYKNWDMEHFDDITDETWVSGDHDTVLDIDGDTGYPCLFWETLSFINRSYFGTSKTKSRVSDAFFEIISLDGNDPIYEHEDIEIYYTIKNTGDLPGEQTVDTILNNDIIDSTNISLERNQLFSNEITDDRYLRSGTYLIIVRTDDDESKYKFTIKVDPTKGEYEIVDKERIILDRVDKEW